MAIISVARKRVIYLHDADLTLDGRVGDPNVEVEAVEVTTFNDSARRNNPGLQVNTFSYTGLYEDSAQRSYETIKDMVDGTLARTLSVYLNTDGSAQTGYGLSSCYANMTFNGGPGEAETIDGAFMQDGTRDVIVSLGSKGTVTTNTVTGTYDRGVTSTSTAGGAMYIHVFTNIATGGNDQWIIHLQDSTTATGAYSDLGSITVGSGTTLGTKIEFSGTVNRFIQGSLNRDSTAGTLDYQLSFVAY